MGRLLKTHLMCVLTIAGPGNIPSPDVVHLKFFRKVFTRGGRLTLSKRQYIIKVSRTTD